MIPTSRRRSPLFRRAVRAAACSAMAVLLGAAGCAKKTPPDTARAPLFTGGGAADSSAVQTALRELKEETGIGKVVPCHFEMFGFNTETPELFLRTASATGQPVRVLRSGERFEVSGT